MGQHSVQFEALVDISGKIEGTLIKPGSLSGALSISGSIGVEALDVSGKIDNVLIKPDTLSSLIETIVIKQLHAALDLPENTAVFVNTSGFLDLALASGSGTLPAIGVSTSCASGAQVTVIRHGIKVDVTSAPLNTPFYVSELSAGILTEVIPATGFVQRMGIATYPPNNAIINPDNFYYDLSGTPQGVVVVP